MKIRELEAFDAYMTQGGTKAAADLLGTGQPTVSRLLGALEQNLGFALFQRKRNSLTPTAEAYLFHAAALRMLASFKEVRNEARAIANKQAGNIVVAAQPIFCDTFLMDAIARFKRGHPDVGLRVLDVGMETLLKMIAERTCDFGLGVTLGTEIPGARVRSIAECEARCLLPGGHPLDLPGAVPLPRLRDEAFVDLAVGSPLRSRVDTLMGSIGVERRIAAEMRHLRGVCGLVERGVGVAIIDPVAELLVQDMNVICKPLIPSITWQVALVEPLDRPLSIVAQLFCDTILHEVDALHAKGVFACG